MKKNQLKNIKIPNLSGVYFFKKGKEILYIGKATSLKDRIKSYFNPDLLHTRGSRIVDMVSISDKIDFQKTDTVLEALILEANLIKKFEPKYNIKEKDNKSYNFVCITNEDEPKIVLERGRSLEFSKKEEGRNNKYKNIYGPFPSQEKLQVALNIIRKIFPFKTNKNAGSKLYSQIGLEVDGENLKRNIRNIKLFFEGKKIKILKLLEREMYTKAKEMKFEEAGELKRQIYALKHINDVALIEDSRFKISLREGRGSRKQDSRFRIEAYDVAHISGKNSVGVKTVMEDGKIKKSDYKKFILRNTKRGDDVGGLREILSRRFKHTEWTLPNLVVVDGGKGQLNVALSCIMLFSKQYLKSGLSKIKAVSVLKDDKHKPKEIMGNKRIIQKYKKEILILNSEAHRFAIGFLRHKIKIV